MFNFWDTYHREVVQGMRWSNHALGVEDDCLGRDLCSVTIGMDVITKKYFEVPGLGCSQFFCDVVWVSAWLSYHSWNYGIFIGWCSYSPWVTHIHKCCKCYTSCLIKLLLQSLKCISIWMMLTRVMCCSFPNSTILTEIWRYTHKTPIVLFFILLLKLMLVVS